MSSKHTDTAIAPAVLNWDETGLPRSDTFDDVYFSKISGIEETRFVFLERNSLESRWLSLPDNGRFVITETGFGTGLNFLCAWQLWRQTLMSRKDDRENTATLHFVSVEKFPLSKADLQRALSLWPELKTLADALIEAYPPPLAGHHRIILDQGRVQLTLIFDDLRSALPELTAPVDAWFLDGFAPSKNPDMWQPTLFAQMARLSHPNTTVATFTCASMVKDSLTEHGFRIQKVPGFGKKREMLIAQPVTPAQAVDHRPTTPSWQRPTAAHAIDTAIIIGGGIAGLSSARALAERGFKVTVLEAADALAKGASGNPQGMLYLKLSAHRTALTQLALASYPLALQQLQRLLPRSDKDKASSWQRCGLIQLGFCEKEQKRLDKLAASEHLPDDLLQAKSAAELSTLAGIELAHDGLWYPDGAWLEPPALCQALADHPLIECITGARITPLQRQNEQWLITDHGGRQWQAPVVIVAAGEHSAQLLPDAQPLPLKPIRGQITTVAATQASAALGCVLCHDGYIAPSINGQHTLGATFNMGETDLELTERDHQHNLGNLKAHLPALADALAPDQVLGGRAAMRCTTSDYLPLIGPVADADAFCATYSLWRKDAKKEIEAVPPYFPGLYLNCGHGSRGMVTGPLSGELIASWVLAEPAPLPWTLTGALHPARFLVRGLKKGKL